MFSTDGLDAVLFDMDGVVTDTAEAHALAWKRLFDEYLNERATRAGEPLRPFDAERDYHEFVDGNDPARETICGLGNRENRYFRDWLRHNQCTHFRARSHSYGGSKVPG